MSAFKVSPEFMGQFKKVCGYYDCDAQEREEMKDAVRRDYEGAKLSFGAMAEEIDAEMEVI